MDSTQRSHEGEEPGDVGVLLDPAPNSIATEHVTPMDPGVFSTPMKPVDFSGGVEPRVEENTPVEPKSEVSPPQVPSSSQQALPRQQLPEPTRHRGSVRVVARYDRPPQVQSEQPIERDFWQDAWESVMIIVKRVLQDIKDAGGDVPPDEEYRRR